MRLNRADIVSAALEVAECSGFDAISMRSVSDALGCTAMALYRHVRKKDELISLVADAAVSQIELATDEALTWSDHVRALATEQRRVMRRYPGLAAYTLSHPWTPAGWRMARLTVERLLAAGFSEPEAELAAGALAVFATGSLRVEHTPPPARRRQSEEQYAYGLDRLIDGIEVALSRTRTPRRARAH